jgi:hypothetical protein
MATTKLTFGSLLQTVTTTANTLTATVATIGKGADMLAAYADKAALEQAYEYSKEHIVFKEEIDTSLADRLASNGLIIKKKCANNEEYSELFNHYLQLIKAPDETK